MGIGNGKNNWLLSGFNRVEDKAIGGKVFKEIVS